MLYIDFLNRVIDDGIAEAEKCYAHDANKRAGALAGFEACRNQTPDLLLSVYNETLEYTQQSFRNRDKDSYWWFRYYQVEVEWVINVVSAMLNLAGGPPLLNHLPTINGMRKAEMILSKL